VTLYAEDRGKRRAQKRITRIYIIHVITDSTANRRLATASRQPVATSRHTLRPATWRHVAPATLDGRKSAAAATRSMLTNRPPACWRCAVWKRRTAVVGARVTWSTPTKWTARSWIYYVTTSPRPALSNDTRSDWSVVQTSRADVLLTLQPTLAKKWQILRHSVTNALKTETASFSDVRNFNWRDSASETGRCTPLTSVL